MNYGVDGVALARIYLIPLFSFRNGRQLGQTIGSGGDFETCWAVAMVCVISLCSAGTSSPNWWVRRLVKVLSLVRRRRRRCSRMIPNFLSLTGSNASRPRGGIYCSIYRKAGQRYFWGLRHFAPNRYVCLRPLDAFHWLKMYPYGWTAASFNADDVQTAFISQPTSGTTINQWENTEYQKLKRGRNSYCMSHTLQSRCTAPSTNNVCNSRGIS